MTISAGTFNAAMILFVIVVIVVAYVFFWMGRSFGMDEAEEKFDHHIRWITDGLILYWKCSCGDIGESLKEAQEHMRVVLLHRLRNREDQSS